MRWIKVSSKKPEALKKVLGYCGGEQVEMMAYDGNSAFIGSDGCTVDHVSHWMEIPYPPPLQDKGPCEYCRHHLSWEKAQEIADRLNKSASRFYASQDWTAEDVMCDHEMEYCIPCSRKDE